MGGEEQRRDDRVSTVLPTALPMAMPVHYLLQGDGGALIDAEIRTALTQDISQSGMCLRIRHVPASLQPYLSPGDRVPAIMQLDLTLTNRRLRLPTRVAWVRPATDDAKGAVLVGVEFLDLKEEHGAEIVAHAKRLAKRPLLPKLALAALAVVIAGTIAVVLWLQQRHETERAGLEKRTAVLSQELAATERQYDTIAESLDEETAELNALADELRAVSGAGEVDGKTAIQKIREALAGVRREIEQLEGEVLADGTCVKTAHCGELPCCTWRDGLCLCDACCVSTPR